MHADARRLLWDGRGAVGRVAQFTQGKSFAEFALRRLRLKTCLRNRDSSRGTMTFATIAPWRSSLYLVRCSVHQENELVPYPERVMANFRAWMAQQKTSLVRPEPVEGQKATPRGFIAEQRWWLDKMAEHIASNPGIKADDFESVPFNERGWLGTVHQLFGLDLPKVIEAMNKELAA